MHPAPSVIVFTTLSGLGFGLLFWLGLGLPSATGGTAFVFFAIAYALAVGGLVSSTFHLGHPERALKAFTQWRSSWLSREGWAAVLALVVMGLFAAGAVFFGARWGVLGLLGSLLSLAVVFTTSMIYAQMTTVPRWKTPLTPVLFLVLSLSGGALLAGQIGMALALMPLAALIQVVWWVRGDKALAQSGTTLGTATQLPGDVRAFEPPHTGTNYLLREFAYVVGRKHASKLRILALSLGFVLPVLMLLVPSHVTAAVAVLSHLIGVAISRWLFFAEAEHVVGLYYGVRVA